MAGKAGTKITWYDTLRSPKGVALFSFIREPDEKFGAKHRIQIFVDPKDPELKPFCAKMMELQATYLKSIGSKKQVTTCPGLKKADAYMAEKFGQYGVQEGSLYFEFTSNARKDEDTDEWKFIPIYNSKNVLSPDLRVFSGDIVRIAVRCGGYSTGKEVGLKPYLNLVQMIEKKSSGGSVNPFADESNGEDDSTEPTSPFEATEDPTEVEETPAPKTTKGKGAKAAKPAKAEKTSAEDVDLSDLV